MRTIYGNMEGEEQPTDRQGGEVLQRFKVRNDTQGVQITKIDLVRESTTVQFSENGTYELVRVDE